MPWEEKKNVDVLVGYRAKCGYTKRYGGSYGYSKGVGPFSDSLGVALPQSEV